LVLLLGSSARAHAQDLTKLATDLAAKIRAKKCERVTVVDFLDLDQKSNKLTKFMTLQLQSALTEPALDLVVVDQGHIAELFDQMDKLSQGLIDPATARKLGKIAGTDVVIYGTVMVSSLSVRLDVSAIDLQTAKVIASGSASPKRFGMLDKLAREADHEEMAAEDEEEAPVKKASTKKAPPRSRRDQGFLFDLHECSLSGDSLTCTLSVTSEGRDRWIAVGTGSRAWNETGEEFPPSDLAISNTQARGCVTKTLLKDVPTNLTLTFPDFATDDSIVERLRVYWAESNSCYDQYRPVDFEKIAVVDGPSSPSTKQKSGNGVTSTANTLGSKKGAGGFLGRLTDKILDATATTVEKVIDKKAKKIAGDDEDPPKQ
jgi:hypothetical protein